MKHHKHPHQQGSTGEQNPDPKKIEHRAYELYLDRGSEPGHDFEDWLRAERELKERSEAAPVRIAV
jgi:hypothetical protein